MKGDTLALKSPHGDFSKGPTGPGPLFIFISLL